jgi:hypothetical protein
MEYLKDISEGSKYFDLENQLSKALKPVQPNAAFIDSLKHKLATGSTTILEYRHSYLGYVALGLGLFAGALIIWLFQRKR